MLRIWYRIQCLPKSEKSFELSSRNFGPTNRGHLYDLMREVEGVGVEYEIEWVMKHIVEVDGERVNIEDLYCDLLDECYPAIKFGDLEYSPSHVLESVDPMAFRMGVGEYADSEVEDGRLTEVGGKYYPLDEVTE